MLKQQLQTLPAVGYASSGAIFVCRYMANIKLFQEMWLSLVDYEKSQHNDYGRLVSYSFDLLIFAPKLTNLNKQHVQVAYMLAFPTQ